MGRVYDFNCQAHSNVNRILFVIGFLLQPTFEIYIYIYIMFKDVSSRENIYGEKS